MTDATHTYWISIGRNVGAEPMSEQDWCDFFANVHTACLLWGDVITNVTGRSFWNGDDEEARLILVSIDTDYGVANLRSSLARWAKHYRQDAIGMVGGPGTDTLVRG
jgi:hypothetical protein